MLNDRKITATFAGETLEVSVAKDCPQGVVLANICCGAWLWANSQDSM